MTVATAIVRDVECGRLIRLGAHTAYVDSTPGAAANSGIVVGRDAVLVVDSRMTPRLGADVLAAARDLDGPGSRRTYLVNTHHHGDHCFGNGAFAGAVHVASAACRSAMARLWDDEVAKMGRGRPASAAEFAAAPRKLPELELDGDARLDLGGVSVELRLMGPAHTAGDVAVHVPVDGVVFTGDLTFHGHWPFVSEADPLALLAALERCRGLGARTYVPGHGRAEDEGALDRMAVCLRHLVDLALLPAGAPAPPPPGALAGWVHPERVPLAVERLRALIAADPAIAALARPK